LNDNVIALSNLINKERLAVAAKAKEVAQEAADAAVATQEKLSRKIRDQQKIIDDYKSAVPPSVRESCGLSIETVRAINKIIDNINEVQNDQIQNHDNGPTATGGGSNLPDTDRVRGTGNQAPTNGGRGVDSEDRDRVDTKENVGAVQAPAETGGSRVHAGAGAGLHEDPAGALQRLQGPEGRRDVLAQEGSEH
jgi:hypothetical protein